jgi:hypothetical protein
MSSSQRSPGGPSSKASRSDEVDEDEVQSMQFKIILLGDGAVGKVFGSRTTDFFSCLMFLISSGIASLPSKKHDANIIIS